MNRNTRQMLISILILLLVALVSAAGFVSCDLQAPGGSGDPAVRGVPAVVAGASTT